MCIGLFKKQKFEIVNNKEEAEIIVINTCGFIQAAKEEAINTILEMAKLKETGKCKFLIVMGCLVQRYKEELEKAIPEVDLFLKIDEYDDMWNKIAELVSAKKSQNTLDYLERIISTGNTTAYLKIAEGCSNNCTYCAIPYIRGPYISRKYEDIIKEAKQIAKSGIKELIVIAQDTTKYGIDLYGKPRLPELLNDLCKIKEIKWIRFLYAYPESITDELIEVVKKNKKICKYFDIPIQHYSDRVLKMMNRKSDGKSIEGVINKIRKEIPDVILRTTMIVGFPGETEKDFKELCGFVERAKFEKLGVFKYSKEDGTPASRIKHTVQERTKQKRYDQIMSLEQKISKSKLKEKVGKTYEAVVDGISENGKYLCARSYMDIPNEDGTIFIKKDKNTKPGSFIKCKIIGVNNYDLIGELIDG